MSELQGSTAIQGELLTGMSSYSQPTGYLALDVCNSEVTEESFAHAKEVLERDLDKSLIKQRKQGNTTLSYIGGHTVIRLLNEAFNYKWSFEIVSEEVVPSLPKAVTEYVSNKKVNKLDKDGNQVYEEQPPVVKITGRLIVPGYGIKEQYGSKVLIGGASEQETAYKSASTDALKKCATLFGVGLELYEDDDEKEKEAPAKPSTSKPSTPPASSPATPAAKTQAATTASTEKKTDSAWDEKEISRMKELKQILGVTSNAQLDPYIREFLDDQSATTNTHLNPKNISAFNIFLTKKVPEA
jgi:recombination DNA repair RAD52 pathway protein